MEELYLNIINLLSEKVSELSLIDEDYGQLETQEDTYPVTFPCVLLNIGKIQWKNLGGLSQQGDASINVKLAIDCYDDTHIGSGQEEKVRERSQLAKKIHKTMHGFVAGQTCSSLIRVSSQNYSIPGAIKIYESVYNVHVSDIINGNEDLSPVTVSPTVKKYLL